MGQDPAYIHAWLSCTSTQDDDACPEPALDESPVLGFEPGFEPVFDLPPLDSSPELVDSSPELESTQSENKKPAHDQDRQSVLTAQSSRSSLRPRSKRMSSSTSSRKAVYCPSDSDFARLTELLAALPPSPTSRMYSCEESANSSQVWLGTASSANPVHTPLSPSFPPPLVRNMRSHATFGSSSTTASSSLHSPASSFSLLHNSPSAEEEPASFPQVLMPEDFLERRDSWSLSPPAAHFEAPAPPVPPKEKRNSKQIAAILFPHLPPPNSDLLLPRLDTGANVTAAIHPLRPQMDDDILTQKKRKRERFYSFISTSRASSIPSTPTSSTPTPTYCPPASSPYVSFSSSLSSTYLSSPIDDEEQGGEIDPFSSSKFAQSAIPLPPVDTTSISSAGSVGIIAGDPAPLSAPPSSKRSSFVFGPSSPLSTKRLSSALGAAGGLKASPSLPALHTLSPSPLQESVSFPAPASPAPYSDSRKKGRATLSAMLGLGNRRRLLSSNNPTDHSDSRSTTPRLSFPSTITLRGKTRMELTITYHCEPNEDGRYPEDDEREILLRAWAETLGHIRTIKTNNPRVGILDLVIVYKKLDGGNSVASTLQAKHVHIKGVGSVALSWKTLHR